MARSSLSLKALPALAALCLAATLGSAALPRLADALCAPFQPLPAQTPRSPTPAASAPASVGSAQFWVASAPIPFGAAIRARL